MGLAFTEGRVLRIPSDTCNLLFSPSRFLILQTAVACACKSLSSAFVSSSLRKQYFRRQLSSVSPFSLCFFLHTPAVLLPSPLFPFSLPSCWRCWFLLSRDMRSGSYTMSAGLYVFVIVFVTSLHTAPSHFLGKCAESILANFYLASDYGGAPPVKLFQAQHHHNTLPECDRFKM